MPIISFKQNNKLQQSKFNLKYGTEIEKYKVCNKNNGNGEYYMGDF